MKYKVDRSGASHTPESQESELLKLQEELTKTRDERDRLLAEIKGKK